MAVDNIEVFGMKAIETALYTASYPWGRIVKFSASDSADFGEEEVVATREVLVDEGSVEGFAE